MVEKKRKSIKDHAKEKSIWLAVIGLLGNTGYDKFFKSEGSELSSYKKECHRLKKQIDSLRVDFNWHCKVQESEQKTQNQTNEEIKTIVSQVNQNIFLMLNKQK